MRLQSLLFFFFLLTSCQKRQKGEIIWSWYQLSSIPENNNNNNRYHRLMLPEEMKVKVDRQVVQKNVVKEEKSFALFGIPWFFECCCFRFIKVFLLFLTFLLSSISVSFTCSLPFTIPSNWQNSTFHVCTIYFTLSLDSFLPSSRFFSLKQKMSAPMSCRDVCAALPKRSLWGWSEGRLKAKIIVKIQDSLERTFHLSFTLLGDVPRMRISCNEAKNIQSLDEWGVFLMKKQLCILMTLRVKRVCLNNWGWLRRGDETERVHRLTS